MTNSPRRLAFLGLALVAIAAGVAWLALGRGNRGDAPSASPSAPAAQRVATPTEQTAGDRALAFDADPPPDSGLLDDQPSATDPIEGVVDPRPRPEVAISGRLIDTSGSALADVLVHMEGLRTGFVTEVDASPGVWVGTDSLGTFVFRFQGGIAATASYGDARVQLPGVNPVTVGDRDLDLGDIELPALGSVEVEVLDDAGRPVPEAEVRASLKTSNGFALATDATGRATARHLPPGSYRFFATHESAGRGNAPIDLEAGANAKLRIELRRAP